MDNASFELGVIGGFLLESYHPTPLKGVVGEWGLVPEHFSDSTNRAAFAAVMAADSADPLVLAGVLARSHGVEYIQKAMDAAQLDRSLAEDRIRRLAEKGRKDLAAEEIARLLRLRDSQSEDYFLSEMNRIVREAAASAVRCRAGEPTAPVSVGEFLSTPPAELDPVVACAFERGDKVELIAPSKCRKSFWALDLAIHCACGRAFCGLGIPKKRRVLLVNLEIKRDWMKRRVLARLAGYGIGPEELGERLMLMNCRGRGLNVREAILARVQILKPDLVILDPRYKLMRPDEDENTGNGLIGILNLLDSIAEEGAAVMIVSHDRKGDVKVQDIRDRGAGSNWAGRDVDCRFVMTPDRSDEYRLSVGVLARNYSPRKPLDLRAEPGRFTSL